MHPEQVQCINDNQTYFVDNMTDVKPVCDRLLSKGVLTREMKADIMAETTDSNKVRKLSDQIIKKGGNAYYDYYQALIATKNDHLAQKLKPHLSPELPPAQGEDGQMANQAHGATSAVFAVSSSQPILICYQTANHSNLIRLRDELRNHGHNVWMDADNTMRNSYGYEALEWTMNNSSVVLMADSAPDTVTDCDKEQARCAKNVDKPIILLYMDPGFFYQEAEFSNIVFNPTDAIYTAKNINALLSGFKTLKNE